MNATCKDRERIFEDGTAVEWAALEAHAETCAECSEELRAWKSLSLAAEDLRDYSPSPELWGKIERALTNHEAQKRQRAERKGWFWFLPVLSTGWQTALAGAFVLLLTISAGWVYWHRGDRMPNVSDESLLKSSALKEVVSTEAAYEKAIDHLAAEAKPQLAATATPLMASYHEKLLVLDSAIADLRAQARLNPSNAQLRYQLLAMYQEKQRTLEEVLGTKKQ